MSSLRRLLRALIVPALVLGLLPAGMASAASPSELFISEYIEGSSNNKAIEMYNGTGATVDLGTGGYALQYYFNGSTSPGLTINLTGTVANGDVHVVAQSSADATILAQADQTSGASWFNGDDAVVLVKSGTVIDSFGQIGVDPGSQWPGGGQDDTLRRLPTVCAGDTDPNDAFDASVEWSVFAQDTFDGLGTHTATCDSTPPSGGLPLPVTEGFDDCTLTGWEIVSVDSDSGNTWACDAAFSNIEANGFGDSAPADEWLISPPLDLDAQDDDTLTFRSQTSFTDSGIPYPQLSVLYSTDYDGSGDPTSATWTELTGAAFSPENSGLWTDSGPVDLSSISGSDVHVAFRYQSSGTGSGTAARWRLDAIEFAEVVPPPPPACATPPEVTPISDVQGDGDATPCSGQTVVIEAVVVGDYEGPSPNLRGFYLQEEDADQDGDPATSEGIFVFNGNANTVSIGAVVKVTGTAAEFQGQTQIGFVSSIEVTGIGSVTPTEVTLPLPGPDFLERYEGMLVTFPQTLYVTEFFQLGRFGQVVVSSGDRLRQPTDIAEPGAPALAVQAANDLNRLIVDDTLNNQNPDPIVFGRTGDPLSASNTLRGGDTLTGATGVMTFTWAGNSASGNAFRLRPPQAPDGTFEFLEANPRPDAGPVVGGSVEVASFNVLNYFLTLDDGGLDCGPAGFPQECRGAESAFELERQRTKLLAALDQIDADVLGLIELENTEGVEPLADLVDGLDDLAGVGTYDYVDTGTVGNDVIKVGILYKPGTVTPLGDPAILDSSVDARFDDDLNRPAVAQTFVENATGEIFTVVVNHLKSKGCSDATGPDLDQGDGQGCFNAARTAAAEALVDWMASEPTGVADPDFLVIGDLNAYAQEDPIEVLAGAGFVDLVREFQGDDSYTYVFDGQWGYLDYALASPSLDPQVTGAAEYHINADEPSVLDYNTNFKSDGQIESLFAPDEFRTSDHDPVLVGLTLSSFEPVTTADPAVLWPPNRKYRSVTVSSETSGGDPLAVWIVEATSSEPDTGLDDDDRPNDIVITGPDTLDLRAERYSRDGRTYTVTALVTADDGQTKLDTATVLVPLSQGRGR